MVEADDAATALGALDLPAPSRTQIIAYLRTLEAWAGRINLTGARTTEERIRLLIVEILPVPPHLVPGHMIDIGSGNGSPGLVLAALRPDLPVTLLEPRQRRWAFLREAARAMGRADIEVHRQRHDEYRGPAATNVVVRGVALPLAELARLTDSGGQAIVIGRRADPEGSGYTSSEKLGPAIYRYWRRSK
jgi:16S rRNA (guanine(527)-N(7))-methyltransferase RsmG